MAALAGDLSKAILGQSDAAKAFRPWWDVLEDNLLYSFVIFGLILLPMTFLSGTPVECTIHPALWPGPRNYTPTVNEASDNDLDWSLYHSDNPEQMSQYAKFLRSYSKKYCTEIHLSPFLLYLPFVFMMIPLCLVAIEKFFVKFYNSEQLLANLYFSLVKTSLDREDVETLEKENIKNSHEIRQAFRHSTKATDSYRYRTIAELIASIVLLVFFCGFNGIKGLNKPLFDCDVHGVLFKCVIPNSRFYYVVYFLGLTNLLGYITLTIYNLLWLLHPKVSALESVLSGCKRQPVGQSLGTVFDFSIFYPYSTHIFSLDVKDIILTSSLGAMECSMNGGPAKDYRPEIRLDFYYGKKSKDFRLLMNLLAESSGGLAQSFRILCVFDKHFQKLWKIQDFKVISKKPTVYFSEDGEYIVQNKCETRSAWVLWNDAVMATYISKQIPKRPIEYTVEINPPTEAPLKSYFYHNIPDFGHFSDTQSLLSHKNASIDSKMSEEEFGLAMASIYKYSCRFDGLEENIDYTVSISIELDGKTITQVTRTLLGSSEKSEPSSPKEKKKVNFGDTK